MISNKIYLLDGGLSTELIQLGYNPANTKLWTGKSIVERPDLLFKAHTNFLNSGSEIIATASYQLSIGLIKEDLECSEEEAKNVIRKSVKIAKEAVHETQSGRQVLIAGSVGPYGACLCDGSEFRGDYVNNLSIEFLIDWHRPRFECLIQEGCDIIAFETIPSIKEASALIKLLSEYPGVNAWLSFSCKNESDLCIGDKFKDAYEIFNENKQLIAIGINCTYPEYVASLLKAVTRNTKVTKPFIVYSNDAKKWDENLKKYVNNENQDPIEIVLNSIPKWIELGVRFVGGCCNINSDNIKQIKSKLGNISK